MAHSLPGMGAKWIKPFGIFHRYPCDERYFMSKPCNRINSLHTTLNNDIHSQNYRQSTIRNHKDEKTHFLSCTNNYVWHHPRISTSRMATPFRSTSRRDSHLAFSSGFPHQYLCAIHQKYRYLGLHTFWDNRAKPQLADAIRSA